MSSTPFNPTKEDVMRNSTTKAQRDQLDADVLTAVARHQEFIGWDGDVTDITNEVNRPGWCAAYADRRASRTNDFPSGHNDVSPRSTRVSESQVRGSLSRLEDAGKVVHKRFSRPTTWHVETLGERDEREARQAKHERVEIAAGALSHLGLAAEADALGVWIPLEQAESLVRTLTPDDDFPSATL